MNSFAQKKKHRFPSPSSTYGQLILSYFLAFMVPFLFLCCALFYLVSHYVTQETVNSHALWATSVLYDIRQLESAMTDIQGQLQYDGTILADYSPEQYTSSRTLIQQLYSLKSSNRAIRTVWYASEDTGYLFSDTGSLSLDMLLSWRYPGLGLSAEEFAGEVLGSTEIRVMRSPDAVYGDDVLIFCYPVLRTRVGNKYRLLRHHVLFVLPESELSAPLREVNPNHNTATECYYAGIPVYSTSGEFTAFQPDRAPDYSIAGTHNTSVDVYQTASQSIFLVRSGRWTLIAHVQNLFAARRRVIFWLTVMALALFSAGCLISLRSARHIYSPIARLRHRTAELSETAEEASSANDFITINQHLLRLSAQREGLSEQLDSSTDVIEGFLTYSLLYGHFESLSSFNAAASPLKLPLHQSQIRVLLLMTKNDVRVERSLLQSAFPDAALYSFLCASSAVEDGIVVIFSYKPELESTLRERLVSYSSHLKAMGVSEPCQGLAGIPLAYLQAALSVNRRLLCTDTALFYADMEPEATQTAQDSVGRSERCGELILRIEQSEQQPMDPIEATSFAHECLLLLQSDELCRPLFANSMPAFLEPYLASRERRTINLQPLAVLLHEYSEAGSEESAGLRMRHYVRIRCMRSDFSLKAMAGDFNMSESGLSNYFKKQFGQSILDYVTELRINQALSLLVNNKISVQEISALVGYANANSFIRRFKQIMNMTPGEYRRELNAGRSIDE